MRLLKREARDLARLRQAGAADLQHHLLRRHLSRLPSSWFPADGDRLFARVTIFQGSANSVDGPIRFPVKTLSEGLEDLPGFLGLFDLANRETGQALMVTLWATHEARAASAEIARKLTQKVVEETGEQVLSVREYEVGHYLLNDLARRA